MILSARPALLVRVDTLTVDHCNGAVPKSEISLVADGDGVDQRHIVRLEIIASIGIIRCESILKGDVVGVALAREAIAVPIAGRAIEAVAHRDATDHDIMDSVLECDPGCPAGAILKFAVSYDILQDNIV